MKFRGFDGFRRTGRKDGAFGLGVANLSRRDSQRVLVRQAVDRIELCSGRFTSHPPGSSARNPQLPDELFVQGRPKYLEELGTQ